MSAIDQRGPDGITHDRTGYRGAVACSAAGISYRQLDYWARTGLVIPGVRTADGSGSARLYSFTDIVVLKVVKRLLDVGVSLQNIRQAVSVLRERDADELAYITLISDGNTVYECRSAAEVVDLLHEGQGLFGIALSTAVAEIQGNVSSLAVSGLPSSTPVPDELAMRRARRAAS